MKKVFFVLMIALCCLFVNCQKEQKVNVVVYGNVYFRDGTPMNHATVICKVGSDVMGQAVTGSDGQYEIKFYAPQDLNGGKGDVSASWTQTQGLTSGYTSHSDNYSFSFANNTQIHVDISF